MEELRGRKRAQHLAAFAYANADTGRTLGSLAAGEPPEGELAEGEAAGEGVCMVKERLGRDALPVHPDRSRWLRIGGKEEDLEGCETEGEGVRFTRDGLLGKLRRDCEAVLERHRRLPLDRYESDASYGALVGKMLATGVAAVSSLRWYLEDPGARIETVMRSSLRTGHRGYLTYLERALPGAGDRRPALAGRLCRLLGVMDSEPNEIGADGLTPLIRAAADGACARVLRGLVAAKADLEARDKGELRAPALWWAASQGHAGAVEELCRLGAKIDAVGEAGAFDSTPMFIAACEGQAEVVAALGRLGADANWATLDGRTPLSLAARNGRLGAVEELGRLDADVGAASGRGQTAVYAAALGGHAGAIELLARRNADVNRAAGGKTPLEIAREKGHEAAAAALERLGGR